MIPVVPVASTKIRQVQEAVGMFLSDLFRFDFFVGGESKREKQDPAPGLGKQSPN